MNQSLVRLANSSLKEYRYIIGLMSGTSLDGLDIALCKISGSGLQTNIALLEAETMPYSEQFKEDLRSVFSKKHVDLEKLTLLNAAIGTLHAELINKFLKDRAVAVADIDCIASHGQTIYHAPKRQHNLIGYPNATLQIGDADHIAVKTGIPVISDFRQKHIAAGAEGAPLALYGDCILFSSDTENRILLNIGGISNFTYLPMTGTEEAIVCTDTGPGNTLLDALSKKYFHIGFDKNGELSRQGNLNAAVLNEMKSRPFFMESSPKTTGPELFNLSFIEQAVQKLAIKQIEPKDLLRTATQLTAETISMTIRQVVGSSNFCIYVSGGGAHNVFLIEKLKDQLPGIKIEKLEELGVQADAKEALLFALLANETICGSAIHTNAGPEIMMGKISLPE